METPAPRVYVGFSIADSMFDDLGRTCILRQPITFLDFKKYLQEGVISCVNPAHRNSMAEIEHRFAIALPPPSAERVRLQVGDSLIVIRSSGLPRKTGNAFEYNPAELQKAKFAFSMYTVLGM